MTRTPNNSWVEVSGFLKTTEVNVWQLLTDPKLTEQYMYNCQLHSEWKLGAEAVWKAQDESGKWVDHVKAQVLVYEPYRHLAFTIFHQATDKRPEVQSELHYTLEPKTDGVRLRIKQGDFALLNLGEEFFERCKQGWEYVMPQLLKTGEALFEKPT
jgi:uncharacterized protein YndB with AHSA1/START domain